MNNIVRDGLRELLVDHGVELCDDPARCKELLGEEFSDFPHELRALLAAVDAGVVDELRHRRPDHSLEMLAERLHQVDGVELHDATWAVESWARALDFVESPQHHERVLEFGRATGFRPRLAAGLLGSFFGGLHGASLWLFGIAVSWGLQAPGQAAVVGLVVGFIRSLRDFSTLVFASILSWSIGAATGVLLLQAMRAVVVWPLSGVVAWAMSVAITRALKRTLGGNSPQDFLPYAPLIGLVGGIVAFPLGSIIAGTIDNALHLPWSWCVVGLTSGAIVAASSSLHMRPLALLRQVLLASVYAGGIGLVAGYFSGTEGGIVGWIIGGALLAFLPAAFRLPINRHRGTVRSVCFSPDDKFAMSTSDDSTTGLWDVEQVELVGFFREHTNGANCVSISTNGKFAVTGGGDQLLFLVNGETGAVEREFVGHTDAVLSVAFAPNGQTFLSGSADHTARLWDVETGSQLLSLFGHSAPVESVAISGQDQALTGSSDGTARLWNLATGEQLRQFPAQLGAVHAVAFTPDGNHALLSDDAGIHQWDLASDKPIRSFDGHDGPVYDLAVSPVDTRFLSAGHDGSVRLWDLQTGTAIDVFHDSKRPVRTVAFSHDGLMALSSGEDRILRLVRIRA